MASISLNAFRAVFIAIEVKCRAQHLAMPLVIIVVGGLTK